MKKQVVFFFSLLSILLLAYNNSIIVKAGVDDWVLGPEIIPQGSGGSFDDSGVGTGSVIKVNGEYKFWYEGYDEAEWHIGYANSSDGETWKKQGQVYDLSTTDCNVGTSDPCVRYIDGIYKMWHTMRFSSSGHWVLGYAESDDGISWEDKTSKLGWTPNANSSNYVREVEIYVYVVDNSTLWMYFVAEGFGDIYYSVSHDSGLNWTQKQSLSLSYRSPCVFRLSNGTYVMYMANVGSPSSIYEAFSDDGISWSDIHEIIPEPGSGWANNRLWDPRVIPNTIADNPTCNLSLNLTIGQWFMYHTGNVGISGCSGDMKQGMSWLNNSGTHACDIEEASSSITINSINGQENNSIVKERNRTFNWTKVDNTIYYQIQIANDTLFTTPFLNLTYINETNYGVYYTENGQYVEFLLPYAYNISWYGYHYYRVRAYQN